MICKKENRPRSGAQSSGSLGGGGFLYWYHELISDADPYARTFVGFAHSKFNCLTSDYFGVIVANNDLVVSREQNSHTHRGTNWSWIILDNLEAFPVDPSIPMRKIFLDPGELDLFLRFWRRELLSDGEGDVDCDQNQSDKEVLHLRCGFWLTATTILLGLAASYKALK